MALLHGPSTTTLSRRVITDDFWRGRSTPTPSWSIVIQQAAAQFFGGYGG